MVSCEYDLTVKGKSYLFIHHQKTFYCPCGITLSADAVELMPPILTDRILLIKITHGTFIY